MIIRSSYPAMDISANISRFKFYLLVFMTQKMVEEIWSSLSTYRCDLLLQVQKKEEERLVVRGHNKGQQLLTTFFIFICFTVGGMTPQLHVEELEQAQVCFVCDCTSVFIVLPASVSVLAFFFFFGWHKAFFWGGLLYICVSLCVYICACVSTCEIPHPQLRRGLEASRAARLGE